MIAWLANLTAVEQWAIGLFALLVVGIVTQWFSQRLNHALIVHRERRTRSAVAAAALCAAFAPALAFLEKARLHGSDLDRPDASVFLRDAFVSHAAAVDAFRPFVGCLRRKAYRKAWEQYCEIAHAGTVEAEFMAETINRDDPRTALQDLIHAILRFAKS